MVLILKDAFWLSVLVAKEPDVFDTLRETEAVFLSLLLLSFTKLKLRVLSVASPGAASARLSADLKEIGNRMARIVRVRSTVAV